MKNTLQPFAGFRLSSTYVLGIDFASRLLPVAIFPHIGVSRAKKNMAKTAINNEIRDAVKSALARAEANDSPRVWNQLIHCVAIGYAAKEFFNDPANEDGELKFAELFGGHGFLANCSQFAQALASLEVKDEIYVARPEGLKSKLSAWN